MKGPPGCAQPPSAPDVVTTSRGAGSRSRGLVQLRFVLAASDQRVELDRAALQRPELTRSRHEDARPARGNERVDVSRAEVDGVAARELMPGQRVVVPSRASLRPDRRDRPLPHLVDEREPTALRGFERSRMHLDPALLELRLGAETELVRRKRGEEEHGVGELRKLHGGNGASAGGLDPRIPC